MEREIEVVEDGIPPGKPEGAGGAYLNGEVAAAATDALQLARVERGLRGQLGREPQALERLARERELQALHEGA